MQELRGQVEEMQREQRQRTAAAVAASALAPAAGACAVKDEPGSAADAVQDCSAQQMLQSGQPILCAPPPAELPQPPQQGCQAMGVVVERGKASLYVKVRATDLHRRGKSVLDGLLGCSERAECEVVAARLHALHPVS
jgi:hypothetical protein